MDSAEFGFNRQRARPVDVAVWLLRWLVWIICLPVSLPIWLWRRAGRR